MADMNLSLQQAQAWLTGAQVQGDGNTRVQRVHTDSRSLQAGDLFVALQGERFDAHDFLSQVATTGATAVMAVHGLAQAQLPGLQVPDTRLALGQLAQGWRSQFDLPVIAVTGSNGKTTVTQMLASILRTAWGEQALATQGNLNNDIGVPQTLLRLRAGHRCAVVELGMNHPGEIAGLARMAQPTVALVNNAQREHQEHMGSIAAVAQENGEVIRALPPDGVAVFPAADAHSALWRNLAGARSCVCFSGDVQTPAGVAQVQLIRATWQHTHWQVQAQTPAGELQTQLHIAGQHNVTNALAATACALAAGISLSDIAQGLAAFEPVHGRSRALLVQSQSRQITLVDDTYNANPDSVLAAIDVLAQLPAPRLLVLGDMGEVGNQGLAFHQEVGQHAQAQGIEHLVCLGELTQHTAQAYGVGAQHANSIEAVNQAVLALLPQLGSVLVKGSRFMKMERVTQAIQAGSESPAASQKNKESTTCC